MADERREPTEKETVETEEAERELERDEPREGEPWAKVNSGDADNVTTD